MFKKRDKDKFAIYEKKEPSLIPLIMIINLLIAGVLVLMVYFTYRHITAEEEPLPPPRAVPAAVEIEEDEDDEIEDDSDYAEEEIPAETKAPVVTQAITPPPIIISPS